MIDYIKGMIRLLGRVPEINRALDRQAALIRRDEMNWERAREAYEGMLKNDVPPDLAETLTGYRPPSGSNLRGRSLVEMFDDGSERRNAKQTAAS